MFCDLHPTHSQVSPDDAVVRAPLSEAAAVRRPRHAHGAAPPVVLWTQLRLHRCSNTHMKTWHHILSHCDAAAEIHMIIYITDALHNNYMQHNCRLASVGVAVQHSSHQKDKREGVQREPGRTPVHGKSLSTK